MGVKRTNLYKSYKSGKIGQIHMNVTNVDEIGQMHINV